MGNEENPKGGKSFDIGFIRTTKMEEKKQVLVQSLLFVNQSN